MAPVFDAYIIASWSAATEPATGANSIWICCLERTGGALSVRLLANPATRPEAQSLLAETVSDLVARDRVTLLGFDFCFGFPAGFAERLRPQQPDWHGVWKDITGRFRDDDGAARERFIRAAAINRLVAGSAFPFWACPATLHSPDLLPTRPSTYGTFGLVERRLTELRMPGTQPVWKLHTPGSVGSQTLLGIPHAYALRNHPWFEDRTRIWPFETGLQEVSRPGPDGWRVLLAEVWAGLVKPEVPAGAIRDAVQAQALADHFAGLDGAGRLAPLFAGDPFLTSCERETVEREEGWILGAGAGAVPSLDDYLRDPAAIYRESFARIRGETDLSRLPRELQPVAARLVHACGMPDIIADLAWSPELADAGREALARGAPILCDAEMVAHGIIRSRLRGNPVVCTLNDPATPDLARSLGTTRSAAAVELWKDRLAGSVVAIGNAPTALFHLLKMILSGGPRPAAILAFPVGFVGAAESKEAVLRYPHGVPFLTLRGRRGGSALAAAAVNALAGAAPERGLARQGNDSRAIEEEFGR